MLLRFIIDRLWFLFVFISLWLGIKCGAIAQDIHQNQPGVQAPQIQAVRSSPFPAPEKNDTTFVVDDSPGLDTGCTFRSGGPLIFSIPVTRFVGDVSKLLANKAIEPNAELHMPAFDVDFAGAPGYPPERDRVSFNGHVVPSEFLTGTNDTWIPNNFVIPVEWINFPKDPRPGGTITEALNEIRIDIDTASPPSEENWCTSIDWAALSIKVARPDLLVHGICVQGICNRGSETWTANPIWPNGLDNRGIPFDIIDMGRLDTIGANAGKIATKVAELKRRFGVDKVNIVAHSKGGIDSRHFVENKNDVARLSQIGTPNAGSPIADYIQAGALGLFGIGGSLASNLLAGGAGGYQLTTAYMNGYNQAHGFNPKTLYVSLAGDYSGGGFVDNFLNSIISDGDDTIVPVSSVHALPYAAHLLYSSSGANKQAKHTEQAGSPDIFNLLVGFTSAPLTASASARSASLAPNQSLFNTAPVPGTVIQGQTQTQTIPVDNTGPGSFSLIYDTGNLDMVLVSPSGRRIDPLVAQTDPAITFESSEDLEGFKVEVYTFDTLEAGVWKVEVTGTQISDPSGKESYLVGAWLQESSVNLSAETDKENYAVGEPIVINATIVNSNLGPVLGASASAIVGIANGTVSNIVLLDNGVAPDKVANDGIYTGTFNGASQAGIYQLAITAQGNQPPFSRGVYLQRPVTASTSSFTTGFSDQGVDTNQNGLFDELVINVPVNITKEATYLLIGELTAPNGTVLGTASTRTQLSPGTSAVQLNFDGKDIFQKGLDGPYTLSSIRLAEETADGDALPLVELKDAYKTSTYSYRNFERAAIFIPGTGSDTGIDTNGNGQFDTLEVSLDVDMLEANTYQWSARLADKNGKQIGVFASSGFLNAGPGVITLAFDGIAIGQNGVDGPYRVSDLLIFGTNQSQVTFDVYTTATYQVCQFEGGASCNRPPVANAGADQATNEGGIVKLDGTGSSDPEGNSITYQWTQVEGPIVNLSDPTSPTPLFRAPFVSEETPITFQLVVNDGHLNSDPDQVIVTVNDLGPSLHGIVSDLKSKNPIGGVEIRLIGKVGKRVKIQTTATDASGFYSFTKLVPGYYVVFSLRSGFWPSIKVVKISSGEDEIQNFNLRKKSR